MQSHQISAETKLEAYQITNQKIKAIFEESGLVAEKKLISGSEPYPIFQEVFGDLLECPKVGFKGFLSAVPAYVSNVKLESKSYYGLLEFKNPSEPAAGFFVEELQKKFPGLVEKMETTLAKDFPDTTPQFQILNPGILINLDEFEKCVLPLIKNFLNNSTKNSQVKRLKNCIDNSMSFPNVVKELKKVCGEQGICAIKTECVEDTICYLAKTSSLSVSGRSYIKMNNENPYSVDIKLTIPIEDIKLVEDYFNKLQPRCVTTSKIDHSELKQNHRMFPMPIKVIFTVDSAVIGSRRFLEELRAGIADYQEETLKNYRERSGTLENPPQLDKHPVDELMGKGKHADAIVPASSKVRWSGAKTLGAIVSAVGVGFFVYRLLPKGDTVSLSTGASSEYRK